MCLYVCIALCDFVFTVLINTNGSWNLFFVVDDGKIFVGSGVGEPFGPKCHKGTVQLYKKNPSVVVDLISFQFA